MRLKKYTYLLCCMGLLLVCTLFHSCMEDVAGDCPASPIGEDAYVGLQFGTRSALPSLSESVEKGVKALRVIVFNKDGKVEFNDRFTATNVDRVDNPVFKVSKGEKNIYVIANEDGKVGVSKPLSNQLASLDLTEETLRKITFTADLYTQETAGTNGLLMIGSVTSVDVKGGTSRLSPQFVPMEIARVNSKLTINARKIFNSLGADTTVVINSIQLVRMMQFEYLYIDTINPNAGTTNNPPEIIKNVTVDSVQTRNDYQPLITCFPGTNMRPISQNSPISPMELIINYSVDGNQQDVVTIPVTRDSDSKVRRNTHYTVNLTIHSNRVDVAMDIEEWKTDTVSGSIQDEGSEIIVNKSLIEMDWWELGKRFDTELLVSAGSKQIVKFDGYYISEVDTETVGGAYGAKKKIKPDEVGTKIPWLTILSPLVEKQEIALNNTLTIKMKYTPKPGKPINYWRNFALHDDLYLRFRSGNIVKDVKVMYQNGYISNDMLNNAPNPWPAETRKNSGIHLMNNRKDGYTFFLAEKNMSTQPNPLPSAGALQYSHGDGIKNNAKWPHYDGLYNSGNKSPLQIISDEVKNYPKWGDSESWFIPSREELRTIIHGALDNPKSIHIYLGPKYRFGNQWYGYEFGNSSTGGNATLFPHVLYRISGDTGSSVLQSHGFYFFPICYTDI